MSSRTVFVHLGSRCNLACPHCADRHIVGARHLTWEPGLLDYALTRLAHLGWECVAFTGGEPTIQPCFTQSVKVAAALGFSIDVFTNTIWPPHITPCLLRAMGVDRLVMSVDSLHRLPAHGRPEVESIGQIVKDALNTGLKLVIITTLSRYNALEASDIVQYFGGLDVTHFLQPMDSFPAEAIPALEHEALIRAIQIWGEMTKQQVRANYLLQFLNGSYDRHGLSCGWCKDMIALFPGAIISPCLFVNQLSGSWPLADMSERMLLKAISAWDLRNSPRTCLRPVCFGCLSIQ